MESCVRIIPSDGTLEDLALSVKRSPLGILVIAHHINGFLSVNGRPCLQRVLQLVVHTIHYLPLLLIQLILPIVGILAAPVIRGRLRALAHCYSEII